uniref:Uncharacterized protein n=1 Tax=Laticauda laticaudata TaxID=8630 RepID=A0A8C5S5M1_LATLA
LTTSGQTGFFRRLASHWRKVSGGGCLGRVRWGGRALKGRESRRRQRASPKDRAGFPRVSGGKLNPQTNVLNSPTAAMSQ